MNEDAIGRAGLDIGLFIVGCVGLLALLKLLGAALKLTPFPVRIRPAVERAAPVLGLAAVVAYITFGVVLIHYGEGEVELELIAPVLVLIAFAWSPLYDLVNGVAFRAGRVCQVGDHVEVGDVQGTVTRIGARVLVLRTHTGDEAVLPYGSFSRKTVRRTQSVEGAYVHTFEIDPVPLSELRPLRERVAEVALRCPWSSVRHPPKIERQEDGSLEISVFALHEDYATDVEAAVRKAIAEQHKPQAAKLPASTSPTWLTAPPKPLPKTGQPAE